MKILVEKKNKNDETEYPCLMVHKDSENKVILVSKSSVNDHAYFVLTSDDSEEPGCAGIISKFVLGLMYRPFYGEVTLSSN